MFAKKQLWSALSKALHRTTFPFPLTSTACRLLSSSFTVPNSFTTTKPPLFHFPEKPPLQFSWKINFSSGNAHSTCWICKNAHPQHSPFLVCDSCRTIQPVDHSIDYFQIFGLEKNYEIKDDNLERKYKDWQKKLHPDLVHSKSQKEREFAAEQSARVIDAYRTLSNPRLRAIYILKLEGVDVNEEETISEPQLLAEIMEIREAVDEAPDSKALIEIQSQIREKFLQWSNSFANTCRSQKFEEAIACIRRMTYYDRVNEEILKRL